MPGSLLVALCQVGSTRVPARNRERLDGLVPLAGDAELVVLPEVFACDFRRPGDDEPAYAEDLDGPFVTALVEAASRQGGTWVAGMFERSDDPDRPFNTLVAVDADGVQASYRKIHLYDSFGFRESDMLSPGPRVPRLLGVGAATVGLLTCYDLRFPELARELSRAGADLLLAPAAWVAGDRKVRQWQTLVTARAIENVAYVAAVSQPGPRYTGHSMLVDPRGDVVAEVGDGEHVLSGTVDLALLEDARLENPSLLNRRDAIPWEEASRGVDPGR